MMVQCSIEAQWMWQLLLPRTDVLEEPAADYGGLLDSMESTELLELMGMIQQRLKDLGVRAESLTEPADPVELFIDKRYTIRMGSANGPILVLRPLVKTLFILFLRHPEGILLKQRDLYRKELEEIYAILSPGTSREDVRTRVGRLVNVEDNSFSEKASVLNARLEALLPKGTADYYKIQGYNGHPRRIPLNPLLVTWL